MSWPLCAEIVIAESFSLALQVTKNFESEELKLAFSSSKIDPHCKPQFHKIHSPHRYKKPDPTPK